MSQLFEKKIKIREDKKRPINFSYFLARANRLNKLFIKASSYEPALRKKDEISRWQKAPHQISLFFCQS
ncbi:hypothetical protein CKN94_01735 [Carnobacterium maltaromaticum]|jgi:hypothetical protein|nr:hypothetical protein CKN94_01735 [Carnobacterium maltaromaticum]TFJ79650.1 hypothetical protein CKN97_01735 [Carnobacterium maltaromaticum]